ncbi:hypothetical protein EJ08DRAFT_735934 [Tothia fuscella]|uniref:MARVEL domain-containing protein n=1 Tax=Tothia fuscella TaxID=1048955 RepID=A0A9P4TVJ5_9PEZI|nr:hypothetical protein EJ08DRAFT_735934 [Tothia fuscella]
MASHSYYSNLPNHPSQADLSDISRASTPLKPLMLSPNKRADFDDDPLQEVRRVDETLKLRIRLLRVVSRILATILSLAVLVSISMTLHKFLTTQNIHKVVQTPTGPLNRTAWSRATKTWPTYMYFTIALSSFVLNFSSLVSYCFSVRASNITSTIASTFSMIIMAANIIVWGVAAGIYRYQKGVINESGKHDDLWGWTCSGAAKAIQETFKQEVPFDRYCDIQSAGWYAGLIQVGAMVLSMIIFFMAMRRMKIKKQARRSMSDRHVAPGY